MRVKPFVAGVIVTLIVAVGLAPVGAQQIMRIYGTVSGAPIALLANSSGVLRVSLDGGSIPASTCAAPALSLSGGATTGIAFTATPSILQCISGTAIITTTSTAVTSTVPYLAPDGSAAGGGFAFASNPDMAWYYTTDTHNWSVNGVKQMQLVNGAFDLLTDTIQLRFGASADVSLSRGAANRLDLATGDSLYLVSGGLGVGVTPPSAGEIQASGNLITAASVKFLAAGTLADIVDAKFRFQNAAGTSGFLLNGATAESVMFVRSRTDGAAGGIGFASMAVSGTAPTVTSAGTSPSVTASNGTAAFRVNVGTGGTATTIVMAMPAATTGWNCFAENITATAANRANQRVQFVSSTTTSITVQNITISTGAALAFTASDTVAFICTAY